MITRRTLLATSAALLAAPLAKAETPAFRVPAEDAPHQRTFMQWPVNRAVYPDRMFLELTRQTIARIANTIAAFEPVTMLAAAKHHPRMRQRLSANVALWDIPTDDLWCRDSGPIFGRATSGELAIKHIRFNGWGDKQVHSHDARVAQAVAARLGLPLIDSGLTGEGGGVEQDGNGRLLAHESSWLNPDRNPRLSRTEIEQRLLRAYGAERMIWSAGLYGEDITDYHIDSLARFTAPGRVLVNMPENPYPDDPFARTALKTLEALKDAGLEIEVIPEPTTRRIDSIDFLASYANFYVCNGAVIAAEYGDPRTDATAKDALSRHFPNREIVMLNVDALGELGGGIHCATQQMPAG